MDTNQVNNFVRGPAISKKNLMRLICEKDNGIFQVLSYSHLIYPILLRVFSSINDLGRTT